MNIISNRNQYPAALRAGCVKAYKSQTKRTRVAIAAEYNVSPSTVSRWARVAGSQRMGVAQVAAAKAIAAIQAERASELRHNTPTVQADGSIAFQGRVYK